LEASTFVLAVVGEFSSGKSFLLNALLGKFDLLATDINPSTATITELEYGPELQAFAHHEDGRVERIAPDRLSKFVAVDEDAPARVVVNVDSPFLRRGFTLADTPGLASINPAHRRATLAFLPAADAVLYLIDTQQPFSEGDASFLGIVRRHLDTIFIVQTKIDLWQQRSENGTPAWEPAYERISSLAAVHAPGTYVYPISARDYVEGIKTGDASLIERSRFNAFVNALDASLVRNSGRARLRRAQEQLASAIEDEVASIDRDGAMLELDRSELLRRKSQEQPRVAELEAFVETARSSAVRGAQRMAQALEERAVLLADDAERALTQAFDTADVARLRDRARLHILVDRTLGEAVEGFAAEVAAALNREYDRQVRGIGERVALRFSFGRSAAQAFGGGNHSLWRENPEQALCGAIVLEAIGGPAINLVSAIAERFSQSPPGTYMKRELSADLRSTIWPQFRRDMTSFVARIGEQAAVVAEEFSRALSDAAAQRRDAALGSIDRALLAHDRSRDLRADVQAMRERRLRIEELWQALNGRLDAFLRHDEEIAAADAGAEIVRRAHAQAEFDRESYRRGLRPQRWRVTVLGALRRGKSSLINAFAGRRVLADEVPGEIAYPVHVRYGEQEEAFALQADGTWQEIEIESALEEAARNPVLILTPWKLPRELVLVHAPAFDAPSTSAGQSTLENVCMVAAREASEVLCLFSRQLSDRELALYERVAELGKPMLFAHTLADNESSSERRHVVELAAQYLRERNIPAQRVFTVSTLEYAQSKREQRAAAGWNELDALISTISAHAEEHMARLERLERAQQVQSPPAQSAAGEQRSPSSGAPRGFLGRLLNHLSRNHGFTSAD
jgi:GTPase Era involved in 16S rRNA processing